MDSREEIEQIAAAWIHRRDCGNWSATDQSQLDAWLKASAAHCTVFLRLDSVWREAARLKAFGAGIQPGVVPSREALRASPQRLSDEVHERSSWKWAAAAVLLAAIALSAMLRVHPTDPYYRTDIGGLEGVSMVDGSHVTLNTASEIRIDVTDVERRVDLRQGEAFFEVAKDTQRPFIVVTGQQRIIALGTKFSVRREGDEAQVVVTEGRVRVEREGAGAQVAPPAELTAGTIARSSGQGILIQRKTPGEVEQYLSWRSGFLTFLDVPLGQAVAEFNRYNEQQIVIEDAQVANLHIDGNFRSTNVNAFVRLLEGGFPVRIERRDGRIIVKAQRQST